MLSKFSAGDILKNLKIVFVSLEHRFCDFLQFGNKTININLSSVKTKKKKKKKKKKKEMVTLMHSFLS